MRNSTSPSKYYKLFFVFLVFSSASTSQAAKTTSNPLGGSASTTQIERPLDQATRKNNNQGSLQIDLEKIKEAEADASSSASTNSLQLVSPPLASSIDWLDGNHQEADQTASPSVTSVHQVWTSSSSGRLDELSPEVISKLRNDVPFLAAYALRPRIVGTSEQQSASAVDGAGGDTLQPLDSYTTGSSPAQSPATDSGMESTTELNLQASSPQRSQSVLSSLGAFNEFNVETLSTSKSEHRHRRKTVLKKDSGEDKLSQLKRSLSARTNGLPVRKSKSISRKKRRGNSSKTSKSRLSSTANSQRRKNSGERRVKGLSSQKSQRAKSGRQKRRKVANSKSRMSIIKAGRYFQEQTIGGPTNFEGHGQPEDGGSGLNVGTNSVGDQTTMLVGGTKSDSDTDVGGVKGGSKTSNKKPFYSQARPSVKMSGDEPAMQPGNTLEEDNGEAADENNEEGELDDSPTPKRVGDDDVEEGGDTVTVMPKFDGVDDDPELPANGEGTFNDKDGETNDQVPKEGEGPAANDGSQESGNELPERDEPRTKRINRERPNDEEGNESRDDGESEGNGSAAGGGIGGATGSSGEHSSEGGVKTGSSRGAANESGANDGSTDGNEEDDLPRRKVSDQPGVEFAKDADDGAAGGAGVAAGSTGRSGSSSDDDSENDQPREVGRSGSTNSGDSSSVRGDSEFDSSKKGEADPNGGDAITDSGAEMDVDYRDEMAEAERKSNSGGNRNQGDDDQDGGRKRAGPHAKGDCDDGSYDHFAHHGHHESTKWLRDAVPGEPGEDYPTFSRVNSTSFDCTNKKLPGYYADVESRCQVFHICQADGRQDSFL